MLKISVVTVCYNAADSIEQTMLSVLGQSYPDIEYIVIDGGSTDGTVDIIKKYADRLAYWVSEPDKGIYDAMNKGIAAATGSYINFMNSGDSFYDNRVVEAVVPYLSSDMKAVIYGNAAICNGEKYIIKKPIPIEKINQQGCLCHQAAFIGNLNLKYDLQYTLVADYALFAELYIERKWSFKYIDIPICIYELSGVSDNNVKVLDESYDIARKYGYNRSFLRVKTTKIAFQLKIALKSFLGEGAVKLIRRIKS